MTSLVAILATAFVLVTLAPGAGHADDSRLGQRVQDGAITTLVKSKLVAARPGNFGSIDVDTDGGIVRLRGTVPTEADAAEAERLARGTNGVHRVVNELRVAPRTADPAASRDAGGSTSPGAAGFRGRHTLTGEVTEVDAEGGRVHLRTAQGDLRLQFPPASLQGVSAGDTLTVELALRPGDRRP